MSPVFDREEAKILPAAKADKAFDKHAHDLEDGEGGKANSSSGTRQARTCGGHRPQRTLVNAMEALLDDGCTITQQNEHQTATHRRRLELAARIWYWYQNGCLYPDMASASIAIDPNTKPTAPYGAQGLAPVGRVEHSRFGDQLAPTPSASRRP